MPKSIWFPDDDFEKLVTLAKQAGFRVSRGRGSQLRLFVMEAANIACSGRMVTCPACKGVGYSPKGWQPICGQCAGSGQVKISIRR